MARAQTNPITKRKIQPQKTRWKRDYGSRNNFSVCALINDESEVSRAEANWEYQRPKIRQKSSISARTSRNYHDGQSHKMSQVPLIESRNGGSEENSPNLVILEVGPPGDTWRYSIERDRFAAKSEWFRAMLLGGLAPPPSDPPPTLPLRYVDKRAFDHLLRHLRGEPPDFHSVSTARSTLDIAHQLMCSELALLAVDYIAANLNPSVVLVVYRGLNLYVPSTVSSPRESSTAPSAPPAAEVDEIASACSRLLSECHRVIDAEPDDVLRQENFEDLSACEVAALASRDDLRLRQEGTLFNALEKWAASECRRRGLEPLPSNRRAVLDDEVWYSVRYLLMPSSEFIEGPMRSGVLSPDESAFIATRILGHDSENSSRQVKNCLMAQRLTTTPRNRRVMAAHYTSSGMKPGKKEREDNKRNRRKECASQGHKTCARIGDCIIRVLACVFD